MRIIYLSKDYSPHDHRFLSALARTDHEVFFLRLEKAHHQIEDRAVPAMISEPLWAGGQRAFQWRDVPGLTRDLQRVVDDLRPDLIHAGPIQTCAFVAVRSGFRPVLSMSWGFDLQQDARRNLWWRWVTRYTLRRSTFFTCDAAVTRRLAIRYGMKPDRVSVFPWGVDLTHFKPRTSKGARVPLGHRSGHAKGAAARSFVLLCYRSWEPRYGVEILARGFAAAARRNPRLRLVLLGSGSRAQMLRQILLDAGVLDRVEFGGRVSQADLPRWYRKSDLYISPSHVDGSSVSLLEAMACGLPALVSDIPANKEWVQEDENGWLFRDGDADALAEKILRVAARPRGMEVIGRRARQVAERRADWKSNFPILLRSYEEAVCLHESGGA